MLVTETAWGKRIKTDVLILGTGASGVGAALRAAELKADVLMVGQGRLESSGCLGGGNDHFMAALGTQRHPRSLCRLLHEVRFRLPRSPAQPVVRRHQALRENP